MQFQSTPSSRKVTETYKAAGSDVDISIHTFLAEGDVLHSRIICNAVISIHTFLAEGDYRKGKFFVMMYISIHTFLAEGDVTARATSA